jgi:hypothetical protein
MSPFINEDRFKEWNDAAEYLIGLKKEANVDIVSSLEDIDRLENGKANTVRDYIQKEAWKKQVAGAGIGGVAGAGLSYAHARLNDVDENKAKRRAISGAIGGAILGAAVGDSMGVVNRIEKLFGNRTPDWKIKSPAAGPKQQLADAEQYLADRLTGKIPDSKIIKNANAATETVGLGRKFVNHVKSFAGDVGGGAAFGAGAGVFRANGHPGYEGETGADVAKRYAGNIVGGAATGAMFGGAKKLMQLGMTPSKVANIRDRLIDGVVNTAAGGVVGGLTGALANPEDRMQGALNGAGKGALIGGIAGTIADHPKVQGNAYRIFSGVRGVGPMAAGAYRSKEKTALNLRSLGVPLATGALGAGVGALSADEGHRLEGAAYGGAGGAALGGLARLGMAKKVPGKAPVPAMQGAQPRQLAQTATAPLAQEAQIKQNFNISPHTPVAPNSPIHPMDNRFADVPLKPNNAPVGQYAKEAPPAKPPLDAGWTELVENPLATEVGKNFGPGKDTLSGVYPMNSGGVTKAQPIQAQRMRPEALGSVRGAGDDRIFPPERLKNQALELKGIKLAAAMGGVSSALGKATSFARGAMNNQYVRNGIVGAGMAGATGGDPKIGLGLGLGGTALNRAMSKNTGMANLTSRVPNVTKQLSAPPQPMNAPINISPGVQLMR